MTNAKKAGAIPPFLFLWQVLALTSVKDAHAVGGSCVAKAVSADGLGRPSLLGLGPGAGSGEHADYYAAQENEEGGA
jgi:hypothetical protein